MAFYIHVLALLLASSSFANVKTLTPKVDEILEIKTALGIATIIQIPDSVQQAIVGDQSAYRIEYVDKAVTIKPLRYGAKTNLYLFTQKRRYNLRLDVVPQNLAFYIVYIKDQDAGSGPSWRPLNKVVTAKDVNLKLVKVGTTRDGFLLLDLEVTSKGPLKIAPSDFWARQGAESKTVNSLFLSKPEIRQGQVGYIGMSFQRSELNQKPLVVELKIKGERLRLEVPREFLWK